MGVNHARVAMSVPQARLTHIVDPDSQAGRQVADRFGAAYASDYREVVRSIDAAVVAVPTPLHLEIVLDLLESGVHVLVEKPIAMTSQQGRDMVGAAKSAGRVLAVGHVERFNPVLLELVPLLDQPIHVETVRVGPYTNRIQDGVTIDLMIHDLDIVSMIAKSPIRRVQAIQRDVITPDDLTVALLEFESGLSATLTASRLGQDKVRTLVVTQLESTIRADLVGQGLSVHRVGRVESSDSAGGYRQTGIVEVPFLRHRGEPLFLEIEHFVQCVISGAEPRVGGDDGVAALELVELVRQAATGSPR